MPSFGKASQNHLSTCHPDLQKIFNEVVKAFDCSVTCGIRTAAEQDRLFEAGKSQLAYPHSKHNVKPGELSRAVDVIPYPVDWADLKRFSYFAGFVQGIADRLLIPIRWGGDWDMDTDLKDQNFDDLPHFELV